jgi:general secretion pathway protein A
MGKSSVLRLLFGEYQANEEVIACLIPTPNYASEFAFLKALCAEFNLPAKRSLYDQESMLKDFLMRCYLENKNVVVFIDEAQKLNGKMLEQVRAMLNFETNSDKLIQVVLAAQLELRDRLKDPSKKAIRSRIFAPSLLDPLSLAETEAMLRHRCDLAEIPMLFTPEAVTAVYNHSGGVPRDILKVCSVAYKLMQSAGFEEVGPDLILPVVEDEEKVIA